MALTLHPERLLTIKVNAAYLCTQIEEVLAENGEYPPDQNGDILLICA